LLEKTQLSKPPQLGSDVRPKRLIKEFLYEIQTILRSQYIVYRLGQRGYETLLAHELHGVLSFLNKFNAWIPDNHVTLIKHLLKKKKKTSNYTSTS
jgi:hypothetical protein